MKQNKVQCLRKIADFCIATLGYFSFFLILYYVIYLAKGYYHSDCTDTILWAQASYDAKALMNPEFAYAGLLPFGGQLLMLPFVALFGVGMKAQIAGMVVFSVLFVWAVVFVCKSIGFDSKWISIMVLSVLFMVSVSEKMREIFWGHIIYYSLGIFFLLVGFGLVLRCLKAGDAFFCNRTEQTWKFDQKLLGWFLMLLVWTIMASMNGMQLLTIYGIPVIGALVAERFFDFQTTFTDKKNISRYFVMAVLVAGILLGLIFGKLANGSIVAGYAEAYSSFSETDEWVVNLLNFFPEFFTLLGVDTKTDMLIYSLAGIGNLLRIICGLILIIVPVIMVFLYRKFEDVSYRLFILVHHIMTLLILLGWVFGKLSSANWRLSPIVVTSTILCILFTKWILKDTNVKRMAVIVLLPILCVVFLTTKEIFTMDKQSKENAELTAMAEYLEKENLEYGYGTFWHANIITLLSDSKVKVRNIILDEDGYEKRLYQTNQNWYENVTEYDRYFVIFSDYEYENYYLGNENYERADEILEFGNYKILVYEHNIFG